jgi:hypothetical protein
VARQLLRDSGLADPRFAGDQEDATAPLDRILEPGHELG